AHRLADRKILEVGIAARQPTDLHATALKVVDVVPAHCAALRMRTRLVRSYSSTTSPRWLTPCVCHVTGPALPELAIRLETHTLFAYSVSPGYTALRNTRLSMPRNGPPASLRSSTERPTTVLKASSGLTATPS